MQASQEMQLHIKAVEKEDVVSLHEFKDGLEGFSRKLVLRIPRSLHRARKEEAAAEGVSLNQYMLYKLES
ncbi:MAG: toxin-antitoxin system HicB family antitoxin [Oscillospiraceae bacterium]|nr:toxin-antitoxin system HicB family antitoxin [Oscillospiraceae bacterium]